MQPRNPYAKQYEALGRAMRSLRLQSGLRQGQMARKLRMTQGQASRLESGQQGVRLCVLLRVARALGLRPSDVLREAGL
jgi:transcriptional regulator with XRE-family HTH domain